LRPDTCQTLQELESQAFITVNIPRIQRQHASIDYPAGCNHRDPPPQSNSDLRRWPGYTHEMTLRLIEYLTRSVGAALALALSVPGLDR
jgi:hypothetical protein